MPLMDVSPGSWLSGHLRTLGSRVHNIVPAAYEAHVLVTHRGDVDGGPPVGCLDRLSLAALRDVLVPHTSTPDLCWPSRPALAESVVARESCMGRRHRHRR